jgi:hypothetical protein
MPNGERTESQVEWDAQAVRDIFSTGHAEAVIVTDRNGRVLASEVRRDVPSLLGPVLEASLASYIATGHHFNLGDMRLAASLHDNGTIVCGRTEKHSVFILASSKANLGQLLNQARRVFPGWAFA